MLINYDAVNDNDQSDLNLISYASVQTFPVTGQKLEDCWPKDDRGPLDKFEALRAD